MAVVKCIMMQKDETLLLDGWFRYYGYLFGYENLTVFDNGSTDLEVESILRRYELAGSNVIRAHSRVEDFHAKGSHFKHLILHWDQTEQYDFAIPLDCDEFLTVFNSNGLDCRRKAIHAHLDSLLGQKSALGLPYSFYNVPGNPGAFSLENYPKTFLPSRTVLDIDHGFHACKSKEEAGVLPTKLCYLHFHNKPFALLLSQARLKLERFVDTTDIEKLRRFDGPGRHLVHYFFMTEEEYLRQHAVKPLVRYPYFTHLMEALGGSGRMFAVKQDENLNLMADQVLVIRPVEPPETERPEILFDHAAYLATNTDVASSGWPALQHYLMKGYRESRALGPSPGGQTS